MSVSEANTGSGNIDGIFGTPVEPLFNNLTHGSSSDALQDWLINMAMANAMNIKSCENRHTYFFNSEFAECVILLCEKFELPAASTLSALDIFGSFMQKHLEDLYAHVHNSDSNKKKSDWEAILDRVTNQVYLRILSCCQIASKLNSHYKVITVRQARRCLLEAGFSYTCESILQSEMRVLKTLSYKVSADTCLDFVDLLFEILGYNTNGKVCDIKVYHATSIKILLEIYIHYDDIYNRLYLRTVGINNSMLYSSLDHRRRLAAVKADKLLLAAAVVTNAVHLNDDTLSYEIVCHLNAITEVPVEDIQDFANIILESLRDFTRACTVSDCSKP